MMLGSLSQLATNGCLSASLAVGRFLGSFSKQIRIKSLNSLDLRAPVPSVSQAYVSEGERERERESAGVRWGIALTRTTWWRFRALAGREPGFGRAHASD